MDESAAGTPEAVTEAVDAANRAFRRLERIEDAVRDVSSTSNASVNAGGAANWVCVTAVVVLTVMNAGLGFLYLDLSRRVDRTEDYVMTIFSVVPGLRELVNEVMGKK